VNAVPFLRKKMDIFKTFILFFITALAEIIGCYLPYLWLKKGYSIWLLIPSAISLVVFAWLLTLHPNVAGRVYAAYGGVYISVAVVMGCGFCSSYSYRFGWGEFVFDWFRNHHIWSSFFLSYSM
jgi:drug/metabolite transporter superfamily protein YnfA